ncbi:MAG: hypothetical protein J6D03_00505 [Clostridia bacterium]|nr:hypothetical protein [Clostridia bacterium]
MTDKEVLDYVWTTSNRFNMLNNKGKISQDMIDYISNRYEDSKSLKESIFRMKHNLEVRPVCHICGAPVRFIDNRFLKSCCPAHKIDQAKIKKAIKIKYNVDNISQLDSVKKKVKNTMINRYGVQNAFNLGKEKSIKYRKEHKDEVINKMRQTSLKKFGYTHAAKSPIIKEQIKKTCQAKYGVDCPCQAEVVKAKYNWDIIIEKQWETKRKNGTAGGPHSIQEDRIYEVLCDKYGKDDIIRQYKDKERYPFFCDFYIKSKDLFIEYQGYYTHGNEPYDENSEEHNKILKKLTENNETKTIDAWTIRDPLKRNIAKNNNLNYVEFFTLREAIYRIKNEIYK